MDFGSNPYVANIGQLAKTKYEFSYGGMDREPFIQQKKMSRIAKRYKIHYTVTNL